MEAFLRSTEITDWEHPLVFSETKERSERVSDATEVLRRRFARVGDNIQHSFDVKRNPITGSAPQVLLNEEGSPPSLHGFNAAYLPELGVDAPFSSPVERPETEKRFPDILPDPLPVVVTSLCVRRLWDAMLRNLPDWNNPTLHA